MRTSVPLSILFFCTSILGLPLTSTWISDLAPGEVVQGDGAITIRAGHSETSENGSFEITGDPDAEVRILLPTNPVELSTTNGNQLRIRSIESAPSGSVRLDHRGHRTVYIGGTTESVGQNILPGKYRGSFPIQLTQVNSAIAVQAWCEIHIVSALRLIKRQDLDFGVGLTGDKEQPVLPSQGASFEVRGEPGRSFQILLPQSVPLDLSSRPGRRLRISHFTSDPALLGILDSQGVRTVSVGATRSQIAANQPAGDYVGNFTITVSYP